jgi:hypothetical protein
MNVVVGVVRNFVVLAVDPTSPRIGTERIENKANVIVSAYETSA